MTVAAQKRFRCCDDYMIFLVVVKPHDELTKPHDESIPVTARYPLLNHPQSPRNTGYETERQLFHGWFTWGWRWRTWEEAKDHRKVLLFFGGNSFCFAGVQRNSGWKFCRENLMKDMKGQSTVISVHHCVFGLFSLNQNDSIQTQSFFLWISETDLRILKLSSTPKISGSFLGPILRFATAACIFSTSQLQKVLPPWGVLNIFTSKFAFRHSGVHSSRLFVEAFDKAVSEMGLPHERCRNQPGNFNSKRSVKFCGILVPICLVHVYIYIWYSYLHVYCKFRWNVGKYSIHGASEVCFEVNFDDGFSNVF